MSEIDLPELPEPLARLEREGLERIRAKEEAEEAARRAAEEDARMAAAQHWSALLARARADLPATIHPYLDTTPPDGWYSLTRAYHVRVCLPGRAPIWVAYYYGAEAGWQREEPAKFEIPTAAERCDDETGATEVYWRADRGYVRECKTLAGAIAFATLEGQEHVRLATQGEQTEPAVIAAAAEDDGE